MNWPEIQKIHDDATRDVTAAAERIPPDRWMAPRAEGKWSPAEIVEHLNLAYDALLRDFAGEGGMKIRTKLWQRILLRFTLVPKLLRGAPFPANARAPRETRPATANPDQAAAIAGFRERSARLGAAAAEAVSSRRRVRLTHAYFGRSPVPEAILLCARHMQHHLKQLESGKD
jgi:hypothetical protein